MKTLLFFLGLTLLVSACSHHDKGRVNTTAMAHVDLGRYMGTWHEIARLPNSFEEGLHSITAHYRMMDTGRVAIRNTGYDSNGNKESVYGEAYVPNKQRSGHLRLSFVYPYRWFYGDYNILYVSPDYQIALVAGGNSSYLWLLSRQPHMSKEDKDKLLNIARSRGFKLDNLIYPQTKR